MELFIKRSVVARSFRQLREGRFHPNFAGYLYLQHRAARLHRLSDLQPNFVEFFRYFFEVPDHPPGKPYIRPFTEETPSQSNLWLNTNVAGSYAPSSLRHNQPFRQVVEVGSDNKYSLPATHSSLALHHLLYGQKMPVAELSAFLYRDFSLRGDSPTINGLTTIFAVEFGYMLPGHESYSTDFMTLFSLDSISNWEEDWLERQ